MTTGHANHENTLSEPSAEVDELAREVIGAAIEVHRHFGPGFLESVYEDAMAVELRDRGIPFRQQASMKLMYKSCPVGQGRIDMVVGRRLLVELKAVKAVEPIHRAQVMSYLKATGLKLGLLMNFNVELLKQGLHRIVLS